MSMFGHMGRPDGGYKRTLVDVLDKKEIEKLIDDKLVTWSADGDSHTHGDETTIGINRMLVNRERSRLYSVYYFTTGDATNFAQNNLEINKSVTVTGADGRNTEVIEKQVVTEVVNWYNCSRMSLSDDGTDNTLFMTTGGDSDYGVNYTRVRNKGYMKDCVLIKEEKNMKTLFGLTYHDNYSFYFSFRTTKPNDEIFYFNHEGVIGVYSKRLLVESSGNVSGYKNQLWVNVYDKSVMIDEAVVDKWYIVSVIKNGDKCDVWLDGKKKKTINGLSTANKPSIAKPGLMINGTMHVSDIILFDKVHGDKIVGDMNYWLVNI